jgi:hypothetical protein
MAAAAFAVAKRNRCFPIGRMQRLRQYEFYARHQQLGAVQHTVQGFVHAQLR